MENNIQNQEQPVDNRIDKNEDEIDLFEVVQKLWRNRKFIIKITAVFAILGFFVAIFTPNVYTASCTLVPQTGTSSGGSLGGLAALAGINLGSNNNSGGVLSPSVYPKIISNVNFQKEFVNSKFHFNGVAQPITLYDYYTKKEYQKFNLINAIKKYTIGLPSIIIEMVKIKNNKNVKAKSKDASDQSSDSLGIPLKNSINGNLSVNINSKDGFITLTSEMPEPLVAAELVQKGTELLQKYITEFKIAKVKSNLKFVERSYEEAKSNFEIKQEELARFRDSNKSLASAVSKTQEEKLMSEYNLILGIYTELAKQKEQAKIAVTETTPILTVIEPVVVPLEKSRPNRFMKFLIYTIVGLIVGVGVVFTISYIEENLIPNIQDYKFIPKIE